jgi:signal transduction histidine kinase
MTAQWVEQTIRWPVRAGVGLVRAATLVLVSLLYPAVWALLGWLVWFLATGVGHGWAWTAGEVAFFGAYATLLGPAAPICDILRSLIGRWTGTTMPSGYRPVQPIVRMSTGFWWNGYRYHPSRGRARWGQWLGRRLRDPAGWRDRRALVAAPFSVAIVAAVPPVGVVAGIVAVTQVDSPLRLLGLIPLAVGLGTAPYAWRVATTILLRLLRPSSAAMLSERVQELTVQRADATVAQAAEIRRIERDLHDGAQARLVALGLTLTVAERVVDSDPEQVKALLREAKASTSAALSELRELVRGINPPVLSERGLVDAIRAVALDSPLTATVEVGPGLESRPDAPIESALYFGVSELLTNTIKHARATETLIRIHRETGNIVVEVVDDGSGGATIVADGGLAGLRRRLAVFDGTLAVDSPPGGPTQTRMVVPWTSS